MPEQSSLFPDDYNSFLSNLKSRIRRAQVEAAMAVNEEMITLYWEIGREILDRQQQQRYGTKVVDQLAKDLKQEFPGLTGFSARNLKYSYCQTGCGILRGAREVAESGCLLLTVTIDAQK